MKDQFGLAEPCKLLSALGTHEQIFRLVSLSFFPAGSLHSRVFVLVTAGAHDIVAQLVLNLRRVSFPLWTVVQASRTGVQQLMNQSVPDCPLAALQMIFRDADLKLVPHSMVNLVLPTLAVPACGLGKADFRADFTADRNSNGD